MNFYDTVFVVLVYRNPGDLSDFLGSLAAGFGGSGRVVVVNAYHDETSRARTEKICRARGCDFLNVENRGYGAGNNRGIAYARARYSFRWLAVCNPDTVVRRLPSLPEPQGAEIRGPDIRTRTGKRQNPYMVRPSPLREALLRRYALHPGRRAAFYMAIALNKLERLGFQLFFGRHCRRVYALHGSFLLFSARALEALGAPFDPRMFLFREEDDLARRARRLRIPVIYDPRMRVLHQEDGSLRLSDANVRARTLESLRVYFGLSCPGK